MNTARLLTHKNWSARDAMFLGMFRVGVPRPAVMSPRRRRNRAIPGIDLDQFALDFSQQHFGNLPLKILPVFGFRDFSLAVKDFQKQKVFERE